MNGACHESLAYSKVAIHPAQGFVEREVDGELLYYRQGCEFLTQPAYFLELSVDRSIIPEARTCAVEGNLFVERICARLSDFERRGWFLETAKPRYESLTFEDIIGVRLPSIGDPLIYHTSSPGTTLDRISEETPSSVVRIISKLLAKATRELHDHSVQYTETVPTNFKYAFGNKIILNPHNCMRPMSSNGLTRHSQIVRDLAVILHTHAYIKDERRFLTEYNANSTDFDDAELQERVSVFCQEIPAWINSGDLPLASMWASQSPPAQKRHS